MTWGMAPPDALACASISWVSAALGNSRSARVMVLAVTPLYVAPPLLPVNFGMHGGAYGEANCGADGVHLAPVLVVPVPALMPPEAG